MFIFVPRSLRDVLERNNYKGALERWKTHLSDSRFMCYVCTDSKW